VTDAVSLRPTRAGAAKFGLLYAAFIMIPISITFLVVDGLSVGILIGIVAGFGVAASAFALFVASGLYGLTPTEGGLRAGSRRSRVLPWTEVDRVETGRFLGQEIWVRVIGRPEGDRKPPVLAVFPAFVYGMSAPEMRDYLVTYISRRTGSPT
jgi:hypothetical protein